MATFLLVLKIIGIIILVILALLLLIICLVLFVPIRYALDAKIDETDFGKESDKLPERVYVKASFHWLLHFISGVFEYPGDEAFKVKVLFFKVFPKKEKAGSKEEEVSADTEPAIEAWNEEDQATEAEEASAEPSESSEEVSSESEMEYTYSTDFEEETEKEGFLDFLGKIKDTIVNIIKVPQDVFLKLKCTISSMYAKIDMIKTTLENDIFKRAFEVTKKQLLRVLKMILPKKCKINLRLGMEDVAATADIFSVYGILYPVLCGKVYLTPEFEKQVLEGKAVIRGRIRIFTILWAAVVVYFNKDVKKTIRRFKKIIGS